MLRATSHVSCEYFHICDCGACSVGDLAFERHMLQSDFGAYELTASGKKCGTAFGFG